MNLEIIRELAFKHLGDRKAHHHREKGFIYYHGQRVANLAVQLRKMLLPEDNSRDEMMMVASFFHDVAKGIEPHCQYGSILARALLKEHCEADALEEIVDIIRCHQLRDAKQDYPKWVKIVQDADILDHFGIVEIWMNFQYYAHESGSILDSLAYYKNEFFGHAASLKDLLNYELSLDIYNEKIDFINSFVTRMALEANGEICMDNAQMCNTLKL